MGLVDRHRVTVAGDPDGQPVMFVHGFGCDQTMWRRVWPAFQDDDRIVLFDQAGASGLDASIFDFERHETLAGYARDLVALCEELELRDVILVGHSVGAMIGALACIAAPERFAALVMVSPSPRYLDDDGYVGGFSRAEVEGLLETMDRNYLGWSSTMASVVAGDTDSEVAEELENSFCRMDPRIARHFARVTFLSDNRSDLAAVPVPCLVLQSTQDTIAPVEVGRYVDEQLPDSRLVMIDTVGHCPHLSAPDATVVAIQGFRVSPPDTAPGDAERSEDLSDGADGLYHQAPFGYVSTRLDWTIFKANRTLLDLLGLAREQVVGRRLSDLLAPGDRIYHETHYAPLLHLQGAVKEVAADLVGAGDKRYPVLLSSDVVTDERSGVPFIRTGVVDISDRRRYEEELLRERRRAEASEARERTLRQALAELAAAVTTDHIVEVIEEFATRVIGEGEVAVWLLSRDGRRLERRGSAPEAVGLDAAGVATDAPDLRSMEVIEDRDGRTLTVPLRAGSRMLGVVTVRRADPAPLQPHGRDLLASLGQQAGQALERGRLYEDKDRMLGMVAHDLRTPLATIGGFAQTLQRFLAEDLEPTAAQALERIVRTTGRLARLTDDLLDTSALGLGHLTLHRVRQAVGPVVIDAAAAHRPLAKEKDIPLCLRDHSLDAQAPVDADRLVQVVDNLVSNALKYSPPREPVTVTVTAEPERVRVEIADRGPGIARDELPGLFSAFGRTRNRPTGGETSTGLGLAIARGLIDAHSGDLGVDTQEGVGSTFWFWIPRYTPDEPVNEGG